MGEGVACICEEKDSCGIDADCECVDAFGMLRPTWILHLLQTVLSVSFPRQLLLIKRNTRCRCLTTVPSSGGMWTRLCMLRPSMPESYIPEGYPVSAGSSIDEFWTYNLPVIFRCPLQLRTTSRGLGLFASDDVARGTFLCLYAGELVNSVEATRRWRDRLAEGLRDNYILTLRENGTTLGHVDPTRKGNIGLDLLLSLCSHWSIAYRDLDSMSGAF